MSLQIHWHQGLHLQPHHLQRLQKGVFDLVSAGQLRTWHYPYGMIESTLSLDDLENQRLRFDRLHAILPNGMEVHFPDNAELPARDLREPLQQHPGGLTVSLGVPDWHARAPNVLPPGGRSDTRDKVLYQVKTLDDCCDENTGRDDIHLQVRSLNARLVFDHEDNRNLQVLPLMRILPATGFESNLPRRDPNYTGPCLVLSGSAALNTVVRELVSQIEANRQQLAGHMARSGFSISTMRGNEFEQVMRLRVLNRFSARFPSLLEARATTPFNWYLELRELLGELVAFTPAEDDFKVPAYNHDDPLLSFRELSAKIRRHLSRREENVVVPIPFEKRTDGLYYGTFSEEHFTLPIDYLLAIKTKEDVIQLESFVQNVDKFKLMPRSAARRAYFGVPLKAERNPPLEVPSQAGLYYFRLLRNEENGAINFNMIREEKAAVIKWAENEWPNPDWQIVMYLLLPARTPSAK